MLKLLITPNELQIFVACFIGEFSMSTGKAAILNHASYSIFNEYLSSLVVSKYGV